MILGTKEMAGVPQTIEHKGRIYTRRLKVADAEDAKIYTEPYKREFDIIIGKNRVDINGRNLIQYNIYMRRI